MKRGFIVFAMAPRYYRQAIALGRSLIRHDPDIPRAIVTDSPSHPGFRGVFDPVIPRIEDIGVGGVFRHKLSLDLYSPFDCTIYLDSDGLCTRSLAFAFERFQGIPFGVIGDNRTDGPGGGWGGKLDFGELARRENVPSIPAFQEAFFYLEKEPLGSKICMMARDIMDHYRDYPFDSRGSDYLDGPCLALAMARHGIPAMPNDSTIARTPTGLRGPLRMDVLRGTCLLHLGHPVSPAYVHLPNIWLKEPVYRRECIKLAAWSMTRGSPSAVSRTVDLLLNPVLVLHALVLRGLKRLLGRGREHPCPPW